MTWKTIKTDIGICNQIIPDSCQANNLTFLCTGVNDNFKWVQWDDGTQNDGIAASDGAITLAQGGAGVCTAGEHHVAIAYINRVTGQLSNPTALDKSITVVSDKQIAVTVIPTSGDSQVDGRVVLMTLAGDATVWYIAHTIENNVDVAYNLNISDDDLALKEIYKKVHYPAPRFKMQLTANGRRWGVPFEYPNLLLWSEINMPESFGSSDSYSNHCDYVGKGDGDTIMAIESINNIIIVFKRYNTYKIIGDLITREDGTLDYTELGMDGRKGACSRHCVSRGNGYIIFFDGFTVNAANGAGITPLLPQLEPFFKKHIKRDLLHLCSSIYIPEKDKYVLSIPIGDTDYCNYTMCIDFQRQSYHLFDIPASSFVAMFDGEDFDKWLSSDFTGVVKTQEVGNNDGIQTLCLVISGTVASATATTLVVGNTDTLSSEHIGAIVRIDSGKGENQTSVISAVDDGTHTITIVGNWDVVPDSLSTFSIGRIRYQRFWKPFSLGNHSEHKLIQKARITMEHQESGTGTYRVFRCLNRPGLISIDFNSKTITGYNTDFSSDDVGKPLFVDGVFNHYEIGAVTDATNAELFSEWMESSVTKGLFNIAECNGSVDLSDEYQEVSLKLRGKFLQPLFETSEPMELISIDNDFQMKGLGE